MREIRREKQKIEAGRSKAQLAKAAKASKAQLSKEKEKEEKKEEEPLLAVRVLDPCEMTPSKLELRTSALKQRLAALPLPPGEYIRCGTSVKVHIRVCRPFVPPSLVPHLLPLPEQVCCCCCCCFFLES